jgi:CheY-like chemotaxis protein
MTQARAEEPDQILVVDDDPFARQLVEIVLETGGYQVRSAGHAREAMEILEAGARPKLIISDVMMPGILGTDLVEHLATQPDLARIPVVLISAYHKLASGVKTAAFVSKPFTPDMLLALVGELLAECDPPINVTREPRWLTP